MKPPIVYHGSARILIGERLEPRKARDLNENPQNTQVGIYATDVKNHAIIMAILGAKRITGSSLSISDPNAKGIIYSGQFEQEEVFIYDLPSESFERTSLHSHQFVSLTAVKPIKIEKIKISDYLHLVREATSEEKDDWKKRHAGKLSE